MNLLSMLLPVVCIVTFVGCGDGGGDGAEDTGSTLHVSVTFSEDESRNVDAFTNDLNNDGIIGPEDDLIHDASVTLSFSNSSVVPDGDTATTLRVESYTIDYSTRDPTAPLLQSRIYDNTFTIDPQVTVDRGDIVLASLATIDEFAAGIGQTPPTDFPTEYTAHYTFQVENVPFAETQEVTVNLTFSIGDFLDD